MIKISSHFDLLNIYFDLLRFIVYWLDAIRNCYSLIAPRLSLSLFLSIYTAVRNGL